MASARDAALPLRPALRLEHLASRQIPALAVHQILGERQIQAVRRERLRRQGRHSRRGWCGSDAWDEVRRQGIVLERPGVH